MKARHRQLEHAADLAIELIAPDEAGLFEEGARALMEILLDDDLPSPSEERFLRISDAVDAADRLVQWLNHVVVLAVCDGFFLAAATIDLEGETGLRATLHGECAGRLQLHTEVKAVTQHGLRLERGQNGARAVIIVDV
ncbi:MAG: archease [Myxococcota bacterium]